MSNKRWSTASFFVLLIGISLFSIGMAVIFGNANLSIQDVYKVIGYQLFSIEKWKIYGEGAIYDIVWNIRLPRILLAFIVGMALSTSGAVMQGVVQNPLADPYILGISSGAYLGVILAIVLGVEHIFGGSGVGIMAFFGAFVSGSIVLLLANIGGSASTSKLVLMGVGMSGISSAFASGILYFFNSKEAMVQVMFWTMGSLAGAEWGKVSIVAPIILFCFFFFLFQYRNLNLLLLGDETAQTLGVDSRKLKIYYSMVASLMVGLSVYCAGTIGFVGLIIPHITRMISGSNHKKMLFPCGMFGGIFLLWSDVACRSILSYSELPIGIFVAMIGAPVFLFLLVKHSYGFGGKR